MALRQVPLLLLGAALGNFVPGSCCGSLSHSLCYSYLQLSDPGHGPPQSFIRGYLDGQPIGCFDSLTKKMEPLVPWMEEVENQTFLAPEWVFRTDLEKLPNLDHQAGGLHIRQAVLGCELREDGSKGGFLRYGYHRWNFNSFKNKTHGWGAAHPQAKKVKEKWKEGPGWSEKVKAFLEETCIEWLQRYLPYKNKTLQRAEPPVGKLTRKAVDHSMEILICQAYGFYYPKEIQATWRRDGKVWKNETFCRNMAPNSDGTYYVRLSTEINPKERNRFQCHLEHEGLKDPLVLAWKEETATTWWIPVAIVAAINVGLWMLFLRPQGIQCRPGAPEGSGSRSANRTQARKESAVAQKVGLLGRPVGDV